MKTIRISEAEANKNFLDILNQVIAGGVQVIIEKTGAEKDVVVMPREKEVKKKRNRKQEMKIIEETFGMWKDVPDERIYDDRLRGKRAKEYLDSVRKEMSNVVVDISIIIDHLRKKSDHFNILENSRVSGEIRILIPHIVITELYVGKEANNISGGGEVCQL